MVYTTKTYKLKNLKPSEAVKFLIEHDFELIHRKGSHIYFYKEINGREYAPQVINNYKHIYLKNVERMIKKSGIPKEEWIKELRPRIYKRLKK